MKNIAVIFAGGSGARMGSGIPKQFIEVEGKPIIIHTLEIFEEHPQIDGIYIACKAEYIDKLERLIKRFAISKACRVVPGGVSGQDSIYRGLVAVSEQEDGNPFVLVHDGVRPCVTQDTISEGIRMAHEKGSAVTCTRFYETPVISTDGILVEGSPSRENFYTAQAPQIFRLNDLLAAHETVRAKNPDYSGIIDSCTLMRTVGRDVCLIEGNRGNIKVTTPEDLYVFRAMLEYRENQQALGLSQRDIAESLQK